MGRRELRRTELRFTFPLRPWTACSPTAAWPDLPLYRAHRGKVVTVAIDDNQFRIVHDGTQLSAHPRTFIKEVTRCSASGHATYEI